MLRWLAVLSALLIWASHTLAYGATFDLAILGQGYTDRVKFEADAQRAYQALVSYAPFSEFAGPPGEWDSLRQGHRAGQQRNVWGIGRHLCRQLQRLPHAGRDRP